MTDEARTRVAILTGHYRITGEVEVLPNARLSDFLAKARTFVAVTHAEVWDLNGRKLYSSDFLNVNHQCIEVIMPEVAITQGLGLLHK